MEHHRLRKYRGPETWARVRAAYVAGEPGPSVALRFDVGLSNLRKKARAEGWDRASLARANDLKPIRGEPDPPPPAAGPLADEGAARSAPLDFDPARDPGAAVRLALGRAAEDLAHGRIDRALASLRALQALDRLLNLAPPPPQTVRLPPDPAEVRREAGRLARLMLCDDPAGVESGHIRWVLHWRARNLGPEAAAHDFALAVSRGWAAHHWDAEGRLRPVPEPTEADARMVAQHQSCCAAIAAEGDPEPERMAWGLARSLGLV